jgi:hypothetical protein
MTDERREELIEAVYERWVISRIPEDRKMYWDILTLLVNGRSDKQARRMEYAMGLKSV